MNKPPNLSHLTENQKIRYERILGEMQEVLGPEIQREMKKDDVTEVLSENGTGKVWVDNRKHGLTMLRGHFELERSERLLRVISALLHKPLDDEHPEIAGDLPFVGHRVHGILPPVSPGGPTWSIRKLSSQIYPLSSFGVRNDDGVENLLRKALRDRANILLTGGVGSGKTTFLNLLLQMATEEADGVERHILCEDTRELKEASPATVRLETSETHTLAMLVQSCLRLRPDRIVIGEVRGQEALAALKSWNTGTPGGFFTVHANSAEDGLSRLEQLTLEAGTGPQKALIGQTVDLIIHLGREGKGDRRVKQVLEVSGHTGERESNYKVKALYDSSRSTIH